MRFLFGWISHLLHFCTDIYFWATHHNPDLRDPREAKYYIFSFICKHGLEDSERNTELAEMLMKKGHLPFSKLSSEIRNNPHYGDNHQHIVLGNVIDALLILPISPILSTSDTPNSPPPLSP